jgi:citrate lyase subunit beta / citryl-CoA lyase
MAAENPGSGTNPRTFRSLLWVPGHKLDWMLKAPTYGPDAVVLDLGDSVPASLKAEARARVREAIAALSEGGTAVFVRANGWGSGHTVPDVLETIAPGVVGYVLPGTKSPEDIVALGYLLSDGEVVEGLTVGSREIVPLPESAPAIYHTYDICAASPRVVRALTAGSAIPKGDIARALGVEVDEEGEATVPFGAYTSLAMRAAGVRQVLAGMSSKIDDLDLVRRVASRARRMGANGSFAIHPSHVPVLNEVFLPQEDELEEAREVLRALARAVAGGEAAFRFRGRMLDYAQARTSRMLLEAARGWGMEVGDIPEVDIPDE